MARIVVAGLQHAVETFGATQESFADFAKRGVATLLKRRAFERATPVRRPLYLLHSTLTRAFEDVTASGDEQSGESKDEESETAGFGQSLRGRVGELDAGE